MLDLGIQAHRLVLASCPYEITEDLGLFSFVTLKSCSLNPIKGDCFFQEIEPGTFFNRWGLDNPGAKKITEEVLPKVLKYQDNVIFSTLFQKKEEVEAILEILQTAKIAGLEINVSCPNKESFADLWDIIGKVKSFGFQIPLGIKIGTEFPIDKINSLGIDFITYSNTLPQTHNTYGIGGVSGNPLREIVSKSIADVKRKFKGVVIACGGVRNADDYNHYLSLGADYVALASSYLKNKEVATQILLGI